MRTLTAGDVMNTAVLTVRPDMTARELAAFLVENQISGAPVLDARGKLVGVVSLTDIAESDAERAPEEDRGGSWHGWEGKLSPDDLRGLHVETAGPLVADLMTPTVYAVPEDTPVPLLARTMVSGRIHRLLVTRQHKVVGIVTSLDLLQLLCDDRPPESPAGGGARRTLPKEHP